MIGDPVILVEIDVTAPDETPETLHFADRAFAPMAPGDSLKPNQVWDSRLNEAPALRRMLFEDFASLAPSRGVGVMTLQNNDGLLTAYRAFVWGEVRVWRWLEGDDFADATLLLSGPADLPQYPRSADAPARVQVGFWDYRTEVQTPIQDHLYGGGNDGSTVFYDGEPDALKGQPKPVAYGDLTTAQIPAPQVDAGVLAYQFNDGPIQGSEAIFDRGDGAGLVDDGDLSGAAFDAATPAAAHYVTDLGRGLVKIDGSPVGKVTFGFKGDNAGGYVETAGPVIARLLAKAGVPGGRIGASIAALAAAAVVGVYDQSGAKASDLIDLTARSAPAAVLPDRAGVWQAIPIAPPEAVADFVITPDLVKSLAADGSTPLPVGEVKIGFGRIWATFSRSDLAPALFDTPEQTRLATEYRYATAASATIKARRASTWRTLTVDTALRTEADAQALADALLELFGLRADGSPREQWRAELELTDDVLAIALGKTVRLQFPDLGIDQNMLLMGEELLRPKSDRVIWTVWG